ncbi:MAG: hypothetical protein AAGD25_14780 [Cyanobacteria bacterium P01_F01_bin.150]
MSSSKKQKKRLFDGMGYREVQRSNSVRRKRLSKQKQNLLKQNGYNNIGWDNVINLYQRINEILADDTDDGDTLEDLFLKADRIGSKYQTVDEIKTFQSKMAQEVEAISDKIDTQFPEPDVEYIDFS